MRVMMLLVALSACKSAENTLYYGSSGLADGGASVPAGALDSAEPDVCESASDAPVTWYLSADDSNSKAQAAYVRALIREGASVPGSLRPFEFLNYYDFDYEPADAGRVAIVPQARRSTEDPDSVELLVGVVAPALDPADRKPANFTFSIDASGSMSGVGLERVKDTLRAMAGSFQSGDIVSILTWDTDQRVVLASHTLTGPADAVFLAAVAGIDAGGSTDLDGGLKKAYELARASYDPDRLNRVFLMSDGGANTGETSESVIGGNAEDAEGEGIYMVGIGVGAPNSYSEVLMDRVTDIGKGAYLFIDSEAEAERQFGGARFVENTQIAAYDVRLELDLPAGFVVEEYHGEQISTEASEVRPQHLAPNDEMLYDMVIHDCAPETHDGSEIFTLRVTWSDLSEDHLEVTSGTLAEMMAGENRELTKANAILSYVDGLTRAATAPDEGARLLALTEATGEVSDADELLGGDEDLAEILTLLVKLTTGI